jgi:stage II sporulation protein D
MQEGVIRPSREGLEPLGSLSRLEVAESLYRLLSSRGKPPLTAGRVLEVRHETLLLRVDDLEELHPLAPDRYLFRRVEESTYYSATLSILPDDRVLFHLGEEGIDLLVLRSRGASFDRSSRFSRWVVRKTSEELTAEVNAEAGVGTVTDLRPARYGRSGRVAELEVVGTEGSVTLKGLSIRRRLGIRENLFFLDRQTASDGSITAWVFTGRGWGHGVGLCQVGAYGMAAAGWSYRDILSHYYPGTALDFTGPNREAGARAREKTVRTPEQYPE